MKKELTVGLAELDGKKIFVLEFGAIVYFTEVNFNKYAKEFILKNNGILVAKITSFGTGGTIPFLRRCHEVGLLSDLTEKAYLDT